MSIDEIIALIRPHLPAIFSGLVAAGGVLIHFLQNRAHREALQIAQEQLILAQIEQRDRLLARLEGETEHWRKVSLRWYRRATLLKNHLDQCQAQREANQAQWQAALEQAGQLAEEAAQAQRHCEEQIARLRLQADDESFDDESAAIEPVDDDLFDGETSGRTAQARERADD